MTGKVTHRIQIERLGEVHEWVLRDEPFANQGNLRRAYERGFYQRTRDFNQGERREVEVATATVETVGDAYAHGYFDALKQEEDAAMSYSSEQKREMRTVAFQMDPETYAELERRAKALGLSVGAYVKSVAVEFVERGA